MLESITARLLLDAAAAENFRVDEGVHRLSDLDRADEVYVLSTTNDLTPVREGQAASFKADPSSPARREARPRDGGLCRGARVASLCLLVVDNPRALSSPARPGADLARLFHFFFATPSRRHRSPAWHLSPVRPGFAIHT